MSRLSIAILILIVLGFIMTVKRDEPQYPGTPGTVGTAQTPKTAAAPAGKDKDKDKDKKSAATPQTGQSPAAQQQKPATVASTPIAPGAQIGASPAQKPDDKTAAKSQNGLTEQTLPGNTQTAAPSGVAPPAAGLLEGGENLGRETQKELARLGCFTGSVTNRWGKDGRAAIKRFNVVARYSWEDWPRPDLLASLKRYPDDYCKKCRGGGEECEMAGTQPDKEPAPAKHPVTAVAPPASVEKVTPPPANSPAMAPATPAATPATPKPASTTPPVNAAPQPPVAASAPNENGGEKVASKTEGTANGNAAPYLPSSVKPQAKDDGDEAEDDGKAKKSWEDRDRRERRIPRRRIPVAEEPKPRIVWQAPKPRAISPVEHQYSGSYRSESRSRSAWDARPQGVGR